MGVENRDIRDGWTRSAGYSAEFQTDEQIAEVLELLDPGSATALADVGCGNGAFAVPAAREFPACRVYAFDPLPTAIAECRARAEAAGLDNLDAHVASANDVPLPDASVDRILMRNALHHVADADAVYREFGRILRADGLLLLETPYNAGDDRLGRLLTDLHMLMDDSHPRTYHRQEAIVSGLASHGIVAQSIASWPYPFQVSDEQVALIRRSEAAADLEPTRRDDGTWAIRLSIIRVIAKRAPRDSYSLDSHC